MRYNRYMLDKDWNNKKLRQLAKGDPQALADWTQTFIPWLYARLFFDLGENAADDALAKTLYQAAIQIAVNPYQFNPCSPRLMDLSGQAAAPYKTQTPARQISENTRSIIQKLTTEAISGDPLQLGQTIAVVQHAAALLSIDDQRLLLNKYQKLDSSDHIAQIMDIPAKEIENALYKARYTLRRTMESLAGVEPQTTAAAPTSVAIFEANLETLFRSMPPMPQPSEQQISRATAAFEKALLDNRIPNKHLSFRTKIIAAAAVCLTAAGLLYLSNQIQTTSLPSDDSGQSPQMPTTPQPTEAKDTSEELAAALDAGQRKDVQELMKIIRTGQYPAQVLAAHYLGQYGDSSAIGVLDSASQKWFAGQAGQENPFMNAVKAIEKRIDLQKRQQEYQKIAENVKTIIQTRNAQESPQPSAKEPNLPPEKPHQPKPAVAPEPNLPAAKPHIDQNESNNPLPANESVVQNEPNTTPIEPNQPMPIFHLPILES